MTTRVRSNLWGWSWRKYHNIASVLYTRNKYMGYRLYYICNGLIQIYLKGPFIIYVHRYYVINQVVTPGPVFTKLFRNRIKIRLKLKILLLRTFLKTCNNYWTIDCWYLIKYVLQTRLLGSFFYERKGYFYSWERYENLSPLNNRINFFIVYCLQHRL